jgi:hypothetical protein
VHYWEQAPNHAIAKWLEMAERTANKYKETATRKKNMINANQPLITGFFPGNRAELQERHGDNHITKDLHADHPRENKAESAHLSNLRRERTATVSVGTLATRREQTINSSIK